MALRTLYQTLLDSDPARLRIIAHLWGIRLIATRKADMAAELMSSMASADAVSKILENLPPEQRAALDGLLRQGGALPWAIFVRRSGDIRTVGAGRAEREELWRNPVSAAEALWFSGLVQRTFAEQGSQAVEMAFVPEDLKLYMPSPPEVTIPAPPSTEAPSVIAAGTDLLADDLVTLWSTLQRQATSRDAPHAPESQPTETRLRLIRSLSEERGWIKTDEQGRARPSANAILEWLNADLWTQWSALANAWIVSDTWNDLAHVPELTPDPVNGWPNDPQRNRETFLTILSHCTPGTWYSIETFRDYIKTYAPDFVRQDGIYDTWAPRDTRTDRPLRGFEAWDAVEGNLITHLISGPLSWLGLIDTGQSSGASTTTVFRLSSAGAAILDLAPPPEMPQSREVRLLAGAELLVPRHRRYERFQLSRIAEPEPTTPPEPDKGYRYRLSPASLHRAKLQHISIDRIIAFLKEATSSNELPAPLSAAIQRAYRAQSRVKLTHPWILSVSDPRLLKMPELAPLIAGHLTPELAIIRAEDRLRVRQLLAEKGFLADIET